MRVNEEVKIGKNYLKMSSLTQEEKRRAIENLVRRKG